MRAIWRSSVSGPARKGRPRTGRLAVGIGLFLLAGTSAGGDPAERLGEVREAWRSHETIRAHFDQTQWFAGFEEPLLSSGVLRIQRPRRFELRFDPPHEQRQVCDGTWVWTYDVAQEQVFRAPLGPDAARSADLLDWALEGALPAGAAEADSLADRPAHRLDLVPGENLPLSSLRLWIAPPPETEILGFEAVDTEGNRTRMRFREVRTGVAIDSSAFRFTPPPGVEVIELGSVD
ncbi:MAG: hypothetical protein GF346_11640 [Candidatus Eisenbacteria bacterium]|nr:hypothetical protein [Candidatus Latescibacterota bacterium]MBD3303089.1 hypothetical protein [Candidatus Eisenbacteria bacterium]